MKEITINIKINATKEFRFRIWLSSIVFRLGVKIAGTNIKIDRIGT